MAQAKTRASTKRSGGSAKTQERSKTQASSKAKSKAKARPKRADSNPNNKSPNGKTRIEAARQTVESSTKEVGQTVGKVASKAKTPLLAGGAAVAGAAGGLALSAMRSRQAHSRKVLGVKVPQPKRVKVRSRDVAKAAKEIGTFGHHMGELATELRHAREESGKNGNKHRSPVEVVLDGLTARR